MVNIPVTLSVFYPVAEVNTDELILDSLQFMSFDTIQVEVCNSGNMALEVSADTLTSPTVLP